MTKIKLHLLILFVFILASIAGAQTVNFRGVIGASRVQLTLTRSGAELAGSYFYEKRGNANKLKLKGEIQPDGNFTLKETDDAGKQTGVLKGTWKDDETTFGIGLEGTWQKPQTEDSLGFYASEQKVYFTDGISFAIRNIAENNKLKLFEIDAEYPEITGGSNPGIAKFNLQAKQIVTKSLAEFRKEMLGQTAEDLKFSKQRGISNYMDISYDVAYATNDFVSIQFYDDTFTGGAHPNHSSFALNYDLKNGRILTLAELFQPKSNYLKALSDYSIAKLKAQAEEMTDDEWLTRGAGANAENFRSWNITEKGLMITFDPYQVAAYAAGPQTVLIPYSKLKSILKPNGVLSPLVK
jgi:hypothetical protein